MDDILDCNFPSIIRLLDIMTIGPYLVKHNILQMDEYYNDYQCVLANHHSYNAKLLPKLATKLKKYPQNFITALEECVMNEQCDGHSELLMILQDYMHGSQSVMFTLCACVYQCFSNIMYLHVCKCICG